MQEIPKNLKRWLFGMGPKWHAWMALKLNLLGLACLIVGIVGGASGMTLGLTPTLWVLIAIAAWVWALSAWICAYAAAKEG
jgi:predicted alpha/beta hydrolase